MEIIYAGMFVVEIEGIDEKAYCVNTDEIQELSDGMANAGFIGRPIDITHHMRNYDAPPTEQRLDHNRQFLAHVIETWVKEGGTKP